MKLIAFSSHLFFVQGLLARLNDRAMTGRNTSMENVLIPRSGNKDGRACDFTQGFYVSWIDTTDAIQAWCSHNAGQILHKGDKMAQTVRKTGGGEYMAGKTQVKLYVKYQNDKVNCWIVDEEACNWYLSYISQGCTKGGDRPTSLDNQKTDGGTFYEPFIGSVDMQWQMLLKSEI